MDKKTKLKSYLNKIAMLIPLLAIFLVSNDVSKILTNGPKPT